MSKALKYAMIGAGAWLLYRYLSKPSPSSVNPASQPPSNEPDSGWCPRLPDTQEEIDYWMGKRKTPTNPNAEGY